MKRMLCVLGALGLIGCSPDYAEPSDTPVRQSAPESPGIQRAFYYEGQVWILDNEGRLATLNREKGVRVDQALPERGRDMCLRDGALWMLTGVTDSPRRVLRRKVGSEWRTEANLPDDPAPLVGMDCTGDAITVLTRQRIAEIHKGEVKVQTLEKPIQIQDDSSELNTALFKNADYLYAGLNAGEFATGLYLINRKTAQTIAMGMAERDDSCSNINSIMCHNIYAMTYVPWQRECFALAASMPMMPEAGILKLCGRQGSVLYERPGYEPERYMRFYDLLAVGDRLVALGENGVYQFKDGKLVSRTPYPKLEAISGISVNFGDPDYILIDTLPNYGTSKGYGFRLIPRAPPEPR
ncbi:hypothetical protein PQU92_17825 [Asticcacaulis sp. BYS171W]|uniref:Uncharacterized protein n=1 Tax=Asticcacaulis aquaticus TaxID=2984212 RepID=A0ABT5I0D8_9CAUL|nr:hypothetical protein [Asticcacaulis aquaticus]MDC7685146.1 hypothetical protein [Asticcacaulis aquaticus]